MSKMQPCDKEKMAQDAQNVQKKWHTTTTKRRNMRSSQVERDSAYEKAGQGVRVDRKLKPKDVPYIAANGGGSLKKYNGEDLNFDEGPPLASYGIG
nr:hypothetical protein [Tanacetum cinerariifolium]